MYKLVSMAFGSAGPLFSSSDYDTFACKSRFLVNYRKLEMMCLLYCAGIICLIQYICSFCFVMTDLFAWSVSVHLTVT